MIDYNNVTFGVHRFSRGMFVLALVKQTVRVPAEKFNRDVDQALSEELNLKFANKVDSTRVKLKAFALNCLLLLGCVGCRTLHCPVGYT